MSQQHCPICLRQDHVTVSLEKSKEGIPFCPRGHGRFDPLPTVRAATPMTAKPLGSSIRPATVRPDVELDRLARQFCDEQGVSYREGLRMAQRARPDLAVALAEKLRGPAPARR